LIDNAPGNIIGGKTRDQGNLISGNDTTTNDVGVWIDPTSSANVIAGNLIGTDAAGAASLPNAVGVYIQGPATLVGTNGDGIDDAIERNVISGNAMQGIVVDGTSATKIV
jgi:nitrous oxidase accessory protein NosD